MPLNIRKPLAYPRHPPKKLKLGEQAVYVDTGDPMPDGFNAVIMIEDVNVISGQQSAISNQHEFIEIIEPATPWQNVRVIGEDIVATELILPENHRIRHVDVGAMLAGGHIDVKVRKRPRVVIIPTGTEIVEPGTSLKKEILLNTTQGFSAALFPNGEESL